MWGAGCLYQLPQFGLLAREILIDRLVDITAIRPTSITYISILMKIVSIIDANIHIQIDIDSSIDYKIALIHLPAQLSILISILIILSIKV